MADITGMKFNRLTAVKCVGTNNNREKMWECQCECGKTSVVRLSALKYGLTKSCGCLQREKVRKANTKHGMYNTRLYKIWEDMHNRCYQRSYHAYNHYGGRGITICDEWLHDFQAFYEWAMANGYKDNLSIDRIDVNGNYCPENCRWATRKEQANNTRRSHYLTFNGETHTITERAKITGLSPSCIHGRIGICGWSVEDALTKPAQKRRKIF